MADYFSDVLTQINAVPDSTVSRRDLGGAVKSARFDIAPGAAVLVSDRLFLTQLPPQARVVGGVFEVTSAFGATASNGKIRTETTDLVFSGAGAIDLAAAGQWVIDRVARGLDYIAKKNPAKPEAWEAVYLQVAAITTAVTTGRIRGVILYVD